MRSSNSFADCSPISWTGWATVVSVVGTNPPKEVVEASHRDVLGTIHAEIAERPHQAKYRLVVDSQDRGGGRRSCKELERGLVRAVVWKTSQLHEGVIGWQSRFLESRVVAGQALSPGKAIHHAGNEADPAMAELDQVACRFPDCRLVLEDDEVAFNAAENPVDQDNGNVDLGDDFTQSLVVSGGRDIKPSTMRSRMSATCSSCIVASLSLQQSIVA